MNKAVGLKVDFPIDLLPHRIVLSQILKPKNMVDQTHIKEVSGIYSLIQIIMMKLNFPFMPHIDKNKIQICLFKNMKNGKTYTTKELNNIFINNKNIDILQHISEYGNTINNYNHMLYKIITNIFKINNENFAILGQDMNNKYGYLTFQKNKVPIMNYINELKN